MQSAHERLCAWFAELGCSQAELAGRLGTSASYVSRVLSGNRAVGLQLALAIERESASWQHGPILASEW